MNLADFRISVDVVDWNNTAGFFGPIARVQDLGLGTSDGYIFLYTPAGVPRLELNRIDNEQFTIITQVPVTLDPSQDYRLVFTGIGPVLTGQVFNLSDLNTPLATITLNDATYSSGSVGLLVGGAVLSPIIAGDATFDNFRVEAVPEPGSLSVLAVGLVGLLGYGSRRKRVRSPVVGA